jgi:hypothetical protein
VTRPRHLIPGLFSGLLCLSLAGGAAAAGPGLWEAAQEPDTQVVVADVAARPEDGRQVEPAEQKGGFLGYSFIDTSGYGGRAFEYGYLRSSRSLGLFYNKLEQDSNLDLGGSFLNEHDYHGDLLFDYLGDYRLHLRTESLFHNTDREILFSPNFQTGRTDAPTPANYLAVQDPPSDYGVSVVQDTADFRYRLHNYPLHVNLGYWRFVKDGTIQQRFADTAFEGTPNTVYALPRRIDWQTQEGRVGADAHLGPVDLIYDFRVRVFGDRQPIPVWNYVARNDIHGAPANVGGIQQHNEEPDSRFFSNTVKAHTSLAGGLVAGGSYSIEKRENTSALTDTSGAKHMSVNVQTGALDLVYTPAKEYTFSVKYRRQDLDNENRGLVLSRNFANPVQLVKPPVDSVRDRVTAIMYYKPLRELSVTGEYRGDFLTRNHVSSLPTEVTWALPESSDTHVGSLAVHYRPVKGLRMDGRYSYTTVDHPSYGDSFQKRHEGMLLTTYSRSNSWGGSANVVIRRDWNDEVRYYLINYPLDPLSYTPYPLMSRERSTENATLSGWVVPFAKTTLSAHYAYVQSTVDQGVLFTTVVSGSEAASRFHSRSHVFGVNAAYAATENADLSLMLQQVRSVSAFEPQLVFFSAASDTTGVGDISRQHTVISMLSARGEYRFAKWISGTLDYTVRNYDEKNPVYSAYNGTAHAILAAVSAKW